MGLEIIPDFFENFGVQRMGGRVVPFKSTKGCLDKG